MQTAAQDLTGIERLVRRDRLLVSLALALTTLLAWAYLVRMARMMEAESAMAEMHAAMGMMDMATWGFSSTLMLFLMWAVMMAGMMLPSAAPIILMVVSVYRRRGGQQARISTAVFAAGYLVAWVGFSAVAAVAQAALHSAALMSSGMVSESAMLAGGIFLIAGAYQWLPWKNACLSHCQSPMHFLSHEWREGTGGALLMGMRHGLFCLGCCWALMILLFAVGVMNLLWVAAITILVFLEKLLPQGLLVGRAVGVLLVCWGGYLLATSL